MSRHLSTCNISSRSMQAFLSNLANRQTDRHTNTGKNVPPPLSKVIMSIARYWAICEDAIIFGSICRLVSHPHTNKILKGSETFKFHNHRTPTLISSIITEALLHYCPLKAFSAATSPFCQSNSNQPQNTSTKYICWGYLQRHYLGDERQQKNNRKIVAGKSNTKIDKKIMCTTLTIVQTALIKQLCIKDHSILLSNDGPPSRDHPYTMGGVQST